MEEHGAIIVFKQVKEEGADRVPITREEFAAIFAEAVVDYTVGIPVQMGSFDPVSRYGPYRVAATLEHAKAFVTAVDNLIGVVKESQVEFDVSYVDLLDQVRKEAGAAPKRAALPVLEQFLERLPRRMVARRARGQAN